jgi:hypothetical protein
MAHCTFAAHFARPTGPVSAASLVAVRTCGLTTGSTSGAAGDAVVVTGVFEPALSIKELVALLHVSGQAIYDLRSTRTWAVRDSIR